MGFFNRLVGQQASAGSSLTIRGGGGFSSFPKGFPDEVPTNSAATVDFGGLTLQSSGTSRTWDWSEVLTIRCVKVMSRDYLTGTFADGGSWSLAVTRGATKFVDRAQTLLNGYLVALDDDARARREGAELAAATAAREASGKSARACQLPSYNQARAHGHVIRQPGGEKVGGGLIFMNKDGIIIHDATGQKMLVHVGHEVIGPFRATGVDSELTAEVHGNPQMSHIVIRPENKLAWRRDYREFTRFHGMPDPDFE